MAGAIQPYRPVTNIDRVNALDALIDATRPLFEDVYDRSGNYPEFIRSNEERSPIFDAARAVARFNCRQWAASDKGEYSTRANMGNAELCGPYLDQLGEKPDDGELTREFEGGQCAVSYAVTFTSEVFPFSDCSNFGPSTVTIGLTGPILGTVTRTVNPSGDLCTPGGNYIYLRHGNPATETLLAGAGYGATVTNLSVAREDGLSDNCGQPAPIIRPPATVTPVTPIPPSVTINLPGIGEVEVEVNINAEGDPEICIPILGACETITVGPMDDDDDGGGGGGGGTPPLDPEVGDPIDSPPGGGGGGEDTPFGDPPEGRVWIGAYVRLLGDLVTFGPIPGDEPGQKALPTVVGNASLIVDGDPSGIVRGTHTQLRSEWSDHIAPVVGLTVTGIRVRVNPMLGYRVYPVSVADPALETP